MRGRRVVLRVERPKGRACRLARGHLSAGRRARPQTPEQQLGELLSRLGELLQAAVNNQLKVIEHEGRAISKSNPNTWQKPLASALLAERGHVMALRIEVAAIHPRRPAGRMRWGDGRGRSRAPPAGRLAHDHRCAFGYPFCRRQSECVSEGRNGGRGGGAQLGG